GIGERWILAIYTPTFGPDLVTDGWIAVVTEIDERRRVEKSLNASNPKAHRPATFYVAKKHRGYGWWSPSTSCSVSWSGPVVLVGFQEAAVQNRRVRKRRRTPQSPATSNLDPVE